MTSMNGALFGGWYVIGRCHLSGLLMQRKGCRLRWE
ncbi:hypothetical protein ACVI3U_004653 [Sinorhizobium medicae]